ncbi:putative L-lactate dehydrogenase [Pseudoclavibacter endophyticus]|nr:putative L-lactate dehydrogenase [Pseudoclavibacter endophyticus]
MDAAGTGAPASADAPGTEAGGGHDTPPSLSGPAAAPEDASSALQVDRSQLGRRRVPSVREALSMVRFERVGRTPAERMARAHDIDDLRARARAATPRPIFDFVDGGAGDEGAVHRNRAAFDALQLVPRVLRDVSTIDTSTTLLGRRVAAPIVFAPIGLARAAHPLGEIGLARAAARYGLPTVLSTMASVSPEQLARQVPEADRWMQLYLWRDRDASRAVVRRAADAGFRALMLTLDVPVAGNRLRDVRNGLGFPPSMPLRSALRVAAKPAWAWRTLTHEPIRYALTETGGGDFVTQTDRTLDPSATFAELEWLREVWPGPLLVKGVLDSRDARRLVDAGVDGLVVSNHGGRQLEQAVATAHALPRVREAAGDDTLVLVDGGIRSGAHVAAALALGADAVLVGRPAMYGLMAGGQAGVDRAAELLTSGLTRTMALLGAARVAELEPGMIAN